MLLNDSYIELIRLHFCNVHNEYNFCYTKKRNWAMGNYSVQFIGTPIICLLNSCSWYTTAYLPTRSAPRSGSDLRMSWKYFARSLGGVFHNLWNSSACRVQRAKWLLGNDISIVDREDRHGRESMCHSSANVWNWFLNFRTSHIQVTSMTWMGSVCLFTFWNTVKNTLLKTFF